MMGSTRDNSNDLNQLGEGREDPDQDRREENRDNQGGNINANGDGEDEEYLEVVLEFQAVTGMEDMDESRRILRQHDWDLLRAISAHMGFENVPQHHEMNSNIGPTFRPYSASSSSSSSSAGANANRPNMPLPLVRDEARHRAARENGRGGFFRWIWRLVSAPFDFFFHYFWEFLGYGLRFLRQDPRLAITDPVQDVVSFINAYEANYGRDHPTFYQGSYSQALNDAKRELKFLMVYLHSEQHMDTPTFCRNVMSHQGFCDIIRENMLFWACSVSLPEGYRASQALRENTYPFLALIVLKNNRMTIVSRIEGELNPDSLLTRIHQSVADNEAFLIAERQERLERSMTQTLRQQQDAAYLESLQMDKEKERKKREDKEKLRQLELEKQRKEQEEIERRDLLKRQKIEAGQNLKPEPSPDEPGVVRVVIKLPTGARLERRFLNSDSLIHLHKFVFSRPDAPDYFQIATNFPKRTLNCQPTDGQIPPTFAESGLGKSEMLFVYDLES